ncbi:hypothetical protein CDD80_2144 [Ophiocordyceps camponoti-rufipedis]|uniref:Sulfatase-modifying factor enzyme domain-containing protein n=1 Tax=Ophiocordyceps camponoti-rufipedis TaxID=2004952 RepID=A0A2C5ZKC6_9HYPO|nr:hypothetical protein CDD80_2144 [Ophiocordyceps camponoti-rufipedis]
MRTMQRFILNALSHANTLFGKPIFRLQDWRVVGEYIFDGDGGRHQAFLAPVRDTRVLGVVIKPHERVQIEQSLKYGVEERLRLWGKAGLWEEKSWVRGDEYGLHLLRRTNPPYPLTPTIYARTSLPTLPEWSSIWQAWDTVTNNMLPPNQLSQRPIDLRNPCVFYLGHIPTFLDLQISRATNTSKTEPASFATIFERGIDPDVDDPRRCHDHSVVPDCWPPLADILAYKDKVRARLRRLYADGSIPPRAVARALWVGFEHELMHLETLLYMLLQAEDTLPPPCVPKPDFGRLADEAAKSRVPNQWFDVPAQTIVVGMDDPEDGVDGTRPFGWDNEKPSRSVSVHGFQAKARPITNEEYAQYLFSSGIDTVPASWSYVSNPSVIVATVHSTLPGSFLRGKAVKTVFGLVPLGHALDWPVSASYDELARCASWMGGRIPSADEARSIYAYVETQKKEASTQSRLSKKVPAVNGHLVNDGVTETPPASAISSPSQLYVDLSGFNVGFRNWHPVPVTGRGGSLAGQADMGGLWEWTSSPLRRHTGFEPMPLYPAYTADFFDDKHNIVLGGSWATHPRIAGRKSFVNWYQRNYRYVWAGARLVRDVQ